jgi:hypothetical protein
VPHPAQIPGNKSCNRPWPSVWISLTSNPSAERLSIESRCPKIIGSYGASVGTSMHSCKPVRASGRS